LFSQELKYKQVTSISYLNENLEQVSDYQKEMCKLDIYYPKNKKNAPVVVWFHAGGLTAGKKSIPWALKDKGFVVVGVGYRLAKKVKAENCIIDAAAAISWVFKNIENYNGDPDSIFISGHSAGGYLVLMAGLQDSLLKKHNIETSKLAGIISFSGHTITHFQIRSERGISGKIPVIDEFAPIYYVKKETPPILLVTGDRELEMLGRYEENAFFLRMMKVSGNQNVDLLEMDGYGHNMVYPAFPLLVKFVEKTVKSRKNTN
tara:strand:- start:5904 stop:6686 length:783 start_codon:yes stop_codon:yes gene_type:complete